MIPQIIISRNAGFCMGVKKAFDNTLKLSADYPDTCIFGDIVHNRFAVNKLEESKIRVVKKLQDILKNPLIKNVIIRAHGVSPEVELKIKESGKNIFDLTCLRVKKVQLLTDKLTGSGKELIIFGKESHPEVLGICGYCRGKYHIINSLEQAGKMNFLTLNQPVLISQTTMNPGDFKKLSEFLLRNIPGLEVHNTLCSYPLNIQENALALAKNTDVMLIVGDKNSSNTKTLFDRLNAVISSYFVETAKDIPFHNLNEHMRIGIAGGASTPDFQINCIIDAVREYFL